MLQNHPTQNKEYFFFKPQNCNLGFYLSELNASWKMIYLGVEPVKPVAEPNAPTNRPTPWAELGVSMFNLSYKETTALHVIKNCNNDYTARIFMRKPTTITWVTARNGKLCRMANRFNSKKFSRTGLKKEHKYSAIKLYFSLYYNSDSMRTMSLFCSNHSLPPWNDGT